MGQRLSGATIGRSLSDYRARTGDYPATIEPAAATIPRLSSDYHATIPRLSQSESRAEIFPNFPKTFQKPDQNFFQNRSKNRAVFCATGEELPRARGLGSGRLDGLGGGRQPPERARSGSSPGASRAAGLRVWQSGVLLPLLPCCRCCRAAANRCNAAVGRVRAHYGVFAAWDRYLYPLV